MTILDAIKTQKKRPNEVWDYKLCSPLSFDDDFKITYWYQQEENGPKVKGTIVINSSTIEENQ